MYKKIKTDRLVLRPLDTTDVKTTHSYSGNNENTEYVMRLPNKSERETYAFLVKAENEWKKDAPDFYEFAIMRGSDHVGAVSIYLNDDRTEGELGWIMHKDYWKKGYVTEAAAAVLDFAKNELKLKKVIAHCDGRNIASKRVMEKIGLEFERDDGERYDKFTHKKVTELMYSKVFA